MLEPLKVVIENIPVEAFSPIEFISSLLTPIIAVITILIAYRQYKNDKMRLKHELYEKRIQVYNHFIDYICEIQREGSCISIDSIHRYHNNIFISSFLFDAKIQKYLEVIYQKSISMWNYHVQCYPLNGTPGIPVGPERSRICKEETDLYIWISNQRDESVKLFKEYFSI